LRKPALLALEDGSLFRGESIGADGHAQGEVVFNTSITGYQEILTDPSYCQQIITLTYPHIGNVGTNRGDEEASRIHASGLVVRDCPRVPATGATGNRWTISARTGRGRHRRYRYAAPDPPAAGKGRFERLPDGGRLLPMPNRALRLAREFPGLKGMDLARGGQRSEPYEWSEGLATWPTTVSGRARHALPRGRLRLRHQAQHPADAGGSGLPPHRGAGPDAGAARSSP
jgi:carbamoyl-phosphate synthase small subunit